MNFAKKHEQQYQVPHKQRDIYRNHNKHESVLVPLNLYGGKFYQSGEKKPPSVWDRQRGMRVKGKEMTMVLGRVSLHFFPHTKEILIRKARRRKVGGAISRPLF